jgi:hypothetical protein
MNRLPRWLHRAYAWAFGYFWLPCRLCGRYSGGHEWRDRRGLSSDIADPEHAGTRLGICPTCTLAGRGTER